MTAAPVVAAIGRVDRTRIVGTGGVDAGWNAPGDGRTFRSVFGRGDETFRRLDVASRALVLACEAAGIPRVLTAAQRQDTALVVVTSIGCLDADRQFARSLGSEMLDAPIFPYTLPSTCLGEVALRHGLRGISICLSVAPTDAGVGLGEAARLLDSGEAESAVVATVDALRDGEPACDAVAVVVAHARLQLRSVAPWPPAGNDAFAVLRQAL